jgi:pilus assembly protein CpaF
MTPQIAEVPATMSSFHSKRSRPTSRPDAGDVVPFLPVAGAPQSSSGATNPTLISTNPTLLLPTIEPPGDEMADAEVWASRAPASPVAPDVLEWRQQSDQLQGTTEDLWSTSTGQRPTQGTWESPTDSGSSGFLVSDTPAAQVEPTPTQHHAAAGWLPRANVPYVDPLRPLSVTIAQAIERYFVEQGETLAGERTPERIEAVRRLALRYLRGDRTIAEKVPDAAEGERLLAAVVDEVLGFGPLDPLLRDESVSEIMVTGPHMTYVEQQGRLHEVPVHFLDDAHLMRIIARLLKPLDLTVSPASPIAEGRLPDGTYLNVVIPPSAATGPTLTIRRAVRRLFSLEQLVRIDAMSLHIADFLRLCVASRLNTIIAGSAGTGKTTLLNALASTIDDHERIVIIETFPELQLHQRHIVPLEACPAGTSGGSGAVTVRELVANALHMHPERIIVGECRGSEALGILQAMTTGYDGTITTVRANDPRDALRRIETLAMTGGIAMPAIAVRQQIATGVDLIVFCARLRDGTRRVTHVTEVAGMDGETITTHDLFIFREAGFDMATGRMRGEFIATGARPHFASRIEDRAATMFPPNYTQRSA